MKFKLNRLKCKMTHLALNAYGADTSIRLPLFWYWPGVKISSENKGALVLRIKAAGAL